MWMDWIGVEGRTVSDSREAGHGRRETQLDGKEFVKLRNCFLFSFFSFFLSWCFVLGFSIPPLQRNVGFRISWGLEYAISRETEKGGKNTMIARRGEERRGARTCAREGEREIRTRREKEREASARQKTDR